MLVSLDVETKCDQGCTEACEHALDPNRNAVTIIGASWLDQYKEQTAVFRSIEELNKFLAHLRNPDLLGFNFKFDFRTLLSKGANIQLDQWKHDASLMASVYTRKVDPDYVAAYEAQRVLLNKNLPKGKGHRRTSGGSLKILAPYFLGVEPFWEATTDHNNEEYVTKDAVYTYRLFSFLQQKMVEEGSYTFYSSRFMDWVKLLVKMEQRGVKIDFDLMERQEVKAALGAEDAKNTLDFLWKDAYKAFNHLEIDKLKSEYKEMADKAYERSKDKSDIAKTRINGRYNKLFEKAALSVAQSLNLDSPVQLKWLLKEYLKLDVTDFHDEESTGKPVLKKLANEGREDIKALLDYREQRKLLTAFFPSYKEMAYDGAIHCSFNAASTRTGRLSSSSPNLQQVPRGLHGLFIARPGYKFIIRDQAAIEPRLIAHASDDPVLFTLLEKGVDFHGHNTKIFFGLPEEVNEIKSKYPLQREVGKEVGLAILYGAGAMRLQESAQKRGFIWTQEECREKVKRFREEYEAVGAFQKQLNLTLEGGPVTNLFGRPFRIEDPSDIHMKGFNTLIQGSASDLVLNSAYKAQAEYDRLGLDAHIVLLVHDEIVVEAAEKDIDSATSILDHCMTNYPLDTKWGRIRLKVEGKVSDRWEK